MYHIWTFHWFSHYCLSEYIMPDVLSFFLIFVLVNTMGNCWRLEAARAPRFVSRTSPLKWKKKNKNKKTEPGNEVGLNLKRCFLFLSRISEKKILNFGTAAKRRYFVSFCWFYHSIGKIEISLEENLSIRGRNGTQFVSLILANIISHWENSPWS